MFMKVTGKKDKRWKKRWHSMYQHMYWQILISSKSNLLQVDHNNVLIDSVKKAEADEAIVVRLYEYHNRKTTCRLTAAKNQTSSANEFIGRGTAGVSGHGRVPPSGDSFQPL